MKKIIKLVKTVLFRIYVLWRNFWLNLFAGSYCCPRVLRGIIYRLFGIKNHTININPHCFIGGNKLSIGKHTFINYNNFFDLTDKVSIGNNVNIAMKCTFITSTHKIEDPERRGGIGISSPIEIGDGCWLGANVTVLPGVKIGKGCVVAAGAVVTKNCEENCLYAGVPAKKIKDLNI